MSCVKGTEEGRERVWGREYCFARNYVSRVEDGMEMPATIEDEKAVTYLRYRRQRQSVSAHGNFAGKVRVVDVVFARGCVFLHSPRDRLRLPFLSSSIVSLLIFRPCGGQPVSVSVVNCSCASTRRPPFKPPRSLRESAAPKPSGRRKNDTQRDLGHL
jgi:hypothetical protein